MTVSELLQVAGTIVVLGVALGAGAGGFFYAFKSKANKIQKEQIEQLQKDNETCTENYNNLKAEFHELKGTVATLKDIPLQEIRDGIRDLKVSSEENLQINRNTATTNGKILDQLKSSAVTLVKDTADAKTAVRTVKTDLQGA